MDYQMYSHRNDTSEYTLKIEFQRLIPINIYLSLDHPEAINFINADPLVKGLSPEEKEKKLQQMLDDGNEYLLKMVGIYGSTVPPGTPGQSNNPEDYLDADTDLLNDVTPQEKAQIEKNLSKLGPEYAEIAAIPAALPLLASPAGQAAWLLVLLLLEHY